MAFDLAPKRWLSFPSLSLPNFWDENEDQLATPPFQSGLSIFEDDKKIYVEAAVPGIDPENVEATFQNGYLWIRGETKEEEENKKKSATEGKKVQYSLIKPFDTILNYVDRQRWLHRWDEYRRTGWITCLEYPEFTMKQAQELLTI